MNLQETLKEIETEFKTVSDQRAQAQQHEAQCAERLLILKGKALAISELIKEEETIKSKKK